MRDESSRKKKYTLLKEAGFNSYDANRLKDYSWDKVNYFIETNHKYKSWLEHEMKVRSRNYVKKFKKG